MHWLWLAFAGLIVLLVFVDLGMVTRRPRAVQPVEAFASFALWVVAMLAFSLLVWYVYDQNVLGDEWDGGSTDRLTGKSAWLQFVACYVTELALSLDNIAVLVLLIRHFAVPTPVIGRALFWTIFVTLLFRLGLVAGCAAFMQQHEWFSWALGSLLVVGMVRALVLPDESTDFGARWYVRSIRRVLPVCDTFDGQRVVTRRAGRWEFTPLLLVVVAAGIVDVGFASDSVPALFSITRDPFLAFAGGAMAILSLRSLAMAVSGVVGRFRYLRVSVVFVLLIAAAKTFVGDFSDRATTVSLIAVASTVSLGVLASALHERVAARRAGLAVARPAPITDLAEAADVARRNLRKIAVLIVGTFLLLVVAPIVGVWPGPGGLLVAAAGLALLATEFIWARKLLVRVKDASSSVARRSDTLSARTPAWLAVVVLAAYVGGVAALVWAAPYALPSWTGLGPERSIGPGLIASVSVGPLVLIGYWAWRSVALRRSMARDRRTAGGASSAEPSR